MTYFSKFLTCLALASLVSCEEVIDLNLDTQEKELVIDAYIDWQTGETLAYPIVNLAYTTDYFSATPSEPIQGAIITISDGTTTHTLTEEPTRDSIYYEGYKPHKGGTTYITTQPFAPELNKEYTLSVTIGGVTYTSKDTFLKGVDASDIQFTQRENRGIAQNQKEVTAHIKGTPNEYNAHLIKREMNKETELNAVDDRFLTNTKEAEYIFINVNDDEFDKDEVLYLTVYRVSAVYKSYLDILFDNLGGGGPYGPIPSKVRGNITHPTDASKNPLGAFRLSQSTRVVYTIK